MRKSWQFIIPVVITFFVFSGCKKNMVEENYTPIINPVIPDFVTKVNAGINGFITNESGEAVEGATITAGSATTTTDEYGYFKISNTQFSKTIGFIQVSKDGYFTGYSSFIPVAGKETFTRLKLIPKTIAGSVGSGTGGTVSIAGGATVTLPADAVVIAATNTTYTGNINVSAHWFDPSDMQNTSLTMPGDLTGVDSAGHLNVLQTFGMLAVELTGSAGELLQMAPGKKALLHFPLPSSLQSSAPSYIPLWYFDETKGVWQQEEHAIKNGNSYDGDVSHFSYWNCDIGLPLVNFKAQVIDTALNPLLNVPVSITVTNASNISRTAYTDTNGVVTGLVPANSSLRIDVITACNQGVNAKMINTANEPVDLGAIKINLANLEAVLKGTVTDCNGNPVTNGYVIVTGLGNNAIIYLNNGAFTASGIVCPGTSASIVAFDSETSQQSDLLTADVNQGTNNIGAMQACNITSTEMIRLGDAISLTTYTPPQYMFGGNFYFANDSTSINAVDLVSGAQVFQFSFTGGTTTGEHQLANNRLMYLPGSTWQFQAGTVVNITSYGLIGQFITGSLNGFATSMTTPSTVKTYNIQFNIQRDQ